MNVKALYAAASKGERLDVDRAQLAAALDDANPEMRRLAGRTLVLDTLNTAPPLADVAQVVRDVLGSGDAARVANAEAALDDAVDAWRIPGFLPRRLMPALVDALLQASDRDAGRVLRAIAFTEDVDAAARVPVAALGPHLAGPEAHAVVAILGRAHLGGADLSPVIGLLEVALADARVRYDAARVLGRYAVDTPDPELFARLVAHAESDVRQGALESALDAAVTGADLTRVVPALAKAVGDPAGGVTYHAVKALGRAAHRGVDIAPAAPALRGLLGRHHYERHGWYRDQGSYDDAIWRESPDEDARRALSAWGG